MICSVLLDVLWISLVGYTFSRGSLSLSTGEYMQPNSNIFQKKKRKPTWCCLAPARYCTACLGHRAQEFGVSGCFGQGDVRVGYAFFLAVYGVSR